MVVDDLDVVDREEGAFASRPGVRTVRLLLLGAVARRDALLLRVRGRRLLDDRPHERPVGRDPVGDDVPLLAVPLLEFDGAAALVVRAGHLDAAGAGPMAPSSFRRLSSMFRFSKPQRTSSPVSGFLPNFACAVRIASTFRMPLTMPRL